MPDIVGASLGKRDAKGHKRPVAQAPASSSGATRIPPESCPQIVITLCVMQVHHAERNGYIVPDLDLDSSPDFILTFIDRTGQSAEPDRWPTRCAHRLTGVRTDVDLVIRGELDSRAGSSRMTLVPFARPSTRKRIQFRRAAVERCRPEFMVAARCGDGCQRRARAVEGWWAVNSRLMVGGPPYRRKRPAEAGTPTPQIKIDKAPGGSPSPASRRGFHSARFQIRTRFKS